MPGCCCWNARSVHSKAMPLGSTWWASSSMRCRPGPEATRDPFHINHRIAQRARESLTLFAFCLIGRWALCRYMRCFLLDAQQKSRRALAEHMGEAFRLILWLTSVSHLRLQRPLGRNLRASANRPLLGRERK